MSDPEHKFDLDFASKSLFEVGKTLTNAFFTCLALAAAASMLTLGVGVSESDTVTVPFLELTLSRYIASEVLIVLTVLSFVRVRVLQYAQQVLSLQVLKGRRSLFSGRADSRWFQFYPSAHTYAKLGAAFGVRGSSLWIANILILHAVGVVLPIGLLWCLGQDLFWSLDVIVASSLVMLIFFVVGATLWAVPWASRDPTAATKVLPEIQKHEDRLFTRWGAW